MRLWCAQNLSITEWTLSAWVRPMSGRKLHNQSLFLLPKAMESAVGEIGLGFLTWIADFASNAMADEMNQQLKIRLAQIVSMLTPVAMKFENLSEPERSTLYHQVTCTSTTFG
jgi:hypothetical protein